MKKIIFTAICAVALISPFFVPKVDGAPTQKNACWGQATKAFAKARQMGYHASNQSEPRAGLGNLARTFYEAGLIVEDSLPALGAFLSEDISACTELEP